MQALFLHAWTPARLGEECTAWGLKTVLTPLQVLVGAPKVLFLVALTAMLLRHPDVKSYQIDRVAFGILVLAIVLRAVIFREPIFAFARATWPMIGLTVLALVSVANQPFDQQAWSLLASKLLVPFALFHLAAVVFTEERDLRQFERFALVVLAYLSFTAIAFLCGAHSLIFPRFILDESLGIQADRARGPLLQAVANGVSLSVLGLLALHAYQRKSVGGRKLAILLASVPIAILATMTRAVWITFVGAVLAMLVLTRSRPVRQVCIAALGMIAVAVAVVFSSDTLDGAFRDRLMERSPVEFRTAVYAGGWEMFLQRPWTGWGFHQMPSELPRFVSGYPQKELYPHSTYLELLAEHGVLGLGLYVWLMWEMWRLGRGRIPSREQDGFLGHNFQRSWPVLLGVYWVNAAVVVMSYQFVNALVFTLAGMLAAQRRRAESAQPC